jgi:hypothetical protein
MAGVDEHDLTVRQPLIEKLDAGDRNDRIVEADFALSEREESGPKAASRYCPVVTPALSAVDLPLTRG